MRQFMSRFIVRRLAALALIFVIPVPAAADEAIMGIEQYKTPKARTLATTHQPLLKQMREEIYNCMPWVGVQKAGIGFRQPKGAAEDDRYLSVWIMIDQDEDARFAALPAERRASAMFSRYGTDLLRRMAALQPLVADPNVQGFSVVLSWLKPGTGGAVQPVNETLALFVDKQTTLGFLGQARPGGRVHPPRQVLRLRRRAGHGPAAARGLGGFLRPDLQGGQLRDSQGPEVLGLKPDRSLTPDEPGRSEAPDASDERSERALPGGRLSDRQTVAGLVPHRVGGRPEQLHPRGPVRGHHPVLDDHPRAFLEPEHRIGVDHVVLADPVVARLAEGRHRGDRLPCSGD